VENTSVPLLVVAGLLALVALAFIGRAAVRALRRFVRAFWPHS
jgi:hypothetical protein